MWGKEHATFHWTHTDDDGVGFGQASYYKGKLKTLDAHNPKVVGLIWQGQYEWSARGTYPQYWTQKNEWQKCAAVDGDVEWWCLHSVDDVPLSVKYVPVMGESTVAPGTSVLVLEGRVTADDGGVRLAAASMQHIKPRDHEIGIAGDAKVWMISRK